LGEASQRFALPALGRGWRSRPARKRLRRRKLPEIAAESPASGARFVGRVVLEAMYYAQLLLKNKINVLHIERNKRVSTTMLSILTTVFLEANNPPPIPYKILDTKTW
jgi:hypothetical protein